MLSFLTTNYKSILGGILSLILTFLALKVSSLQDENKSLNDSLNNALSANKNLVSELNRLKSEYEKAQNVLANSNKEKLLLNDKIKAIQNETQSKEYNANPVFINDFNDIVSRLWEQN
ncbi:hypothetical protein [uncultured Helicobacter sp.]|uniref:hypothetical protein n=1 Tax=uncultured Helicobacter sp. TaxID=175537 RepID=UPI00262A7E10|nr:hypothetical protein [uncultured Helicobacter sp.]